MFLHRLFHIFGFYFALLSRLVNVFKMLLIHFEMLLIRFEMLLECY